MVWHEVGKYGVHHGRTLRSPLKPPRASPYTRAGYISKVVVNKGNELETDEIKKHLKNFRIADGFDNDFVVEESQHRGFDPDNEWGRGYQSYDAVLSLNKKKRWLLPQLLREKLDEDKEKFGREEISDPRVVLIERKSAHSQVYESTMSRLRKGDCCGVLDSNGKDLSSSMEGRKKRRKLYHVGDKYKRSTETEINYEVCQSISSISWPCFRETRSNDSRFDFWYGDFRNRAKKSKKKTEVIKYCLSDVDDMMEDYDDYDEDDDEIPTTELQGDAKDYSYEFDLDGYVTKALDSKISEDIQGKSVKIHHDTRPDQKLPENINPASSETVACYGKGCAKLIDCQENTNINNDNNTSVSNTPPASTPQSTMETNTVVKAFKLSVLIDSLHIDDLQDRFKSRYKEGESSPRKFFIAAPFCHHQYLLFETHCDRETEQDMSCEVLATLLCDDRENTYSCDSDSYTITNTCNQLAQLESQKRHLSINDIVDVFDNGCKCCGETVESKRRCDPEEESLKIRKTVVAYDVLNSFIGHKTEVHSLAKASKEICSSPCQRLPDETAEKSCDDHKSFNCANHSKTCEICYTESSSSDLNEGFTALLTCNHWFCNNCWKMHLVAQLQLGKTMVSCPAMECSESIDDATFMSLAPKSYFKYKTIQHDRAFEMNQQWNWCPADKCGLVAKVTKTKGCGIPRDEADTKQATPLPCMCSCSQVWCFGCQDEPHWPASCDQAQSFRHQTKKYQEVATTCEDRVTSVSVRRCPKCQYPIEKDGGCPRMICTKCHAEFCWKCLKVFNLGIIHNCEDDGVASEDIELTDSIGNARFNKHVRISTIHKKARKVEYLFKMYKQVEDISNAVATHHKLMQHKMLNVKLPSKTHALLALCHQRNIPEMLKLMVDTKFISHSVIEGASIHMATSKTKKGHHMLQRLTNDLHFVIIRLEYYMDLKLDELCAALDQATALVEAAKATIIAIGQVTREYC